MKTGTCQYTHTTFVRLFGLGLYDPNRNVAVATRNPDELVLGLNIPTHVHSFQFYDVFTVVIESELGQVPMKSREVNISPVCFCGGELFTIEDGERRFGNDKSVIRGTRDPMDAEWTLFDEISEGKLPGVTHVIRRRDGQIRPFRQGIDVIVSV